MSSASTPREKQARKNRLIAGAGFLILGIVVAVVGLTSRQFDAFIAIIVALNLGASTILFML